MRGTDSQSTSQVTEMSEEVTVVCFYLGEKRYGANVRQIFEAIRMVEITEVPDSPNFVAGIMNLRGKVIPIIDLRKRFRIPSTSYALSNIILAGEIEGKTVGLVVDSVSSVLRIPYSSIDVLDEEISGTLGTIEGIAKLPDGLLLILNLDKILNFEEKNQLETVGQGKGVEVECAKEMSNV